MRAGPPRAEDAGPAAGPSGAARSRPRKPFERPLTQRVLAGGKTQVFRPDEGKRPFSAHVSGPNCFGNVSRRIKKKKSSPQGPYFFVSLTSFEVTRICKMSQALMKGQSASQGGSIGVL